MKIELQAQKLTNIITQKKDSSNKLSPTPSIGALQCHFLIYFVSLNITFIKHNVLFTDVVNELPNSPLTLTISEAGYNTDSGELSFVSVRFSNFGFGSVFRLKARLGYRFVNVGFRLTINY